ncbi:hypothetical protein E2C01_019697 [Portunus trituberculatus]|uniref:Uncharacterized protein n=1 Tax=Portunus trituberculatus TaxID=210409 RepID=A0A5B7E159_PORTR|nr:hypothetical protein [Portunus trituberculatus]
MSHTAGFGIPVKMSESVSRSRSRSQPPQDRQRWNAQEGSQSVALRPSQRVCTSFSLSLPARRASPSKVSGSWRDSSLVLQQCLGLYCVRVSM